MDKKDTIFVDGMFFDRPKEGAPEFIKGKISIKVDKFTPWYKAHMKGKEWINMDLKLSKEGKLYLSLNTYKKPEAQPEQDISFDATPSKGEDDYGGF